jgi:Tol biopolymer transport system component
MNRFGIFTLLLLCLLAISDNSYGQDSSLVLKGPYLGQTPPGLTPKIFAPGLVSINGRFEGVISFSPDLTEVYFGANNDDEQTHIYFSKKVGDEWTPVERIYFTSDIQDEQMHPFVSPDGMRMYFTLLNPDNTEPKIWFVDRKGDGWGRAIKLNSAINADKVFYYNQAKNGDFYYYNLSKGATYAAAMDDNGLANVKAVDIAFGHHAFVSPHQDYLVATAKSQAGEGREDNDVYVYFRQPDGKWGKPINLGEVVNSTFNEKGPSISPDGKYLFFGRDERDAENGLSNIYWVSTDIIKNFKPE